MLSTLKVFSISWLSSAVSRRAAQRPKWAVTLTNLGSNSHRESRSLRINFRNSYSKRALMTSNGHRLPDYRRQFLHFGRQLQDLDTSVPR